MTVGLIGGLAGKREEKRTETPGILLPSLPPLEGTLRTGSDVRGGSQDLDTRQTQLHTADAWLLAKRFSYEPGVLIHRKGVMG